MTNTQKQIIRRSVGEHPRHRRKVIVAVGPGDVIGLRLERESQFKYLNLASLYDQAEIKAAGDLVGFNCAPRALPKRK